MNIETIFNDLGVNAIVATEMMDLLGLNTSYFHIPQRFARFQGIVEYMKDLPEDTRRFLITKATRGKQVSRVDHVFEYVNLLKEKKGYMDQLDNTDEKISKLRLVGDHDSASELETVKVMLQENLIRTEDTLNIYEK